MALCASLTRSTRVLLLPAVLSILSLYFVVLAIIGYAEIGSISSTAILLIIIMPQLIPILCAIMLSSRMDVLENVVAQAGFIPLTVTPHRPSSPAP